VRGINATAGLPLARAGIAAAADRIDDPVAQHVKQAQDRVINHIAFGQQSHILGPQQRYELGAHSPSERLVKFLPHFPLQIEVHAGKWGGHPNLL
jgi:hypothetical protein